ncbi:MAG TPA: hypothetical protein VFI82_14395 [Terriglobales bacterium]|nr:hypothetical protein [Terriglobales bacterium]
MNAGDLRTRSGEATVLAGPIPGATKGVGQNPPSLPDVILLTIPADTQSAAKAHEIWVSRGCRRREEAG